MVCRSTAIGSAMTSFARLFSHLEEQQTLSVFHQLVREGAGAPAPSAQAQAEFIAAARLRTITHSGLTEARRRSLTTRLDTAAQVPMDGRTFYAATRILGRSSTSRSAFNAYADNSCRHQGLTRTEFNTAFDADRTAAETNRSLAAPRPWLAAFRDHAGTGLPLDRQTAYAAYQVEQRATNVTATAERRRSVTLAPVHGSSVINAVGYNPDLGRAEVELHSRPGQPYAYQVPANVMATWRAAPSLGSYWSRNIRGNPAYQYQTGQQSIDEAHVTRCGTCGQFAAPSHSCPVRNSVQEREATIRRAQHAVRAAEAARLQVPRRPAAVPAAVPAGPIVILTPPGHSRQYWDDTTLNRFRTLNANGLLQRARAGAGTPVRVQVDASMRNTMGADGNPTAITPGVTTGLVDVTYNGRGRGYTITPVTEGYDRLRCHCEDYQANYDCVHVRQTVADMSARLNQRNLRETHQPALVTAATAEVASVLAVEHAESLAAQVDARTRWSESEVTYGDNYEAFRTDYQAAKDRRTNGEPPVPYMTENATDGLGSRNGGRSFGVEIEFDFPATMSYADQRTARGNIGRDLHATGMTPNAYQARYGATHGQYRTEHYGGWSFEEDPTVAGEIVSPAMFDTPETWANLQKVCDIVKAHGGVASTRAGQHVHVSAHNYDHTVENHTRLLRTFAANEDIVYRLSANPDRGTHRGPSWCSPNDVPSAGYQTVDRARYANDGHNLAINMQSVHGRTSDHVEFRTWDSNLEPAIMQAQIKMSLAMTEAAFRDTDRDPRGNADTQLGAHRDTNRAANTAAGRLPGVNLTGQAFREDSQGFRTFADQMFRRPEDKAQMASLYAITKWQRDRS